MQERHVRVLLSPGYFDHNQIQQVAERTGAKAIIVPSNAGGAPGVNTFFELINTLVSALAQAFTTPAGAGQ
jgi:hypothetical protein